MPLLIAYALYHKFYGQNSFDWLILGRKFLSLNGWIILFLILMSFFNWSIETIKWQIIIKNISPMRFITAFKSVLAGMAISQVFPNKTGEYIGRMAFVDDENKLETGVLSIWSSLSQLSITLLFGVIALPFVSPLVGQYKTVFLIACFLLLIAVVLSFVFFHKLSFIFKKTKFYFMIQNIQIVSGRTLLLIFILSLFRFMMFALPYTILVHHFALNATSISWYIIFLSVSCVFLMQTVSPQFILTDLMLRMSIPSLVFSGILIFETSIEFIPGLIIYVFNVLLPMLIGAIIFLTHQFRNR
ncbi:MAG: lysylphosphatidylglycerol synthase domain-containing protein [Bacteroidota bacterium]|nr:lysylphosphatidylglycerol synthase domain-containing protein [Bacteroidota bacterium]